MTSTSRRSNTVGERPSQRRDVRALQPPEPAAGEVVADVVQGRRVPVAVHDPRALLGGAADVGERIGGEQRTGRRVVEPHRRRQPQHRLDGLHAARADLDVRLAGDADRAHERPLDAATAEVDPGRDVRAHAVQGPDAEALDDGPRVADRVELGERQREETDLAAPLEHDGESPQQARLVHAEPRLDHERRLGLHEHERVHGREAARVDRMGADAPVEPVRAGEPDEPAVAEVEDVRAHSRAGGVSPPRCRGAGRARRPSA